MIRKLWKLTEGVLFGEGMEGVQRHLKAEHMERENYSKVFLGDFNFPLDKLVRHPFVFLLI